MGTDASSKQAWTHTIRLLQGWGDGTEALDIGTALSTKPFPQAASSADESQVIVTGRASSTTIVVMWRNPLLGYYGAQIWFVTSAPCSGRCELTGNLIKRGDPIFRPRKTSRAPVNGASMILARYVEDMEIPPATENAQSPRVLRARVRRKAVKTLVF